MIQALMDGPASCMSNNWRDSNLNNHPYKVYDPRLGWGMAVRIEDGEVIGRALVYERDDIKRFVRTYQRPSKVSNYSQADDQLNAWLRDQGYSHDGNWEGCLLRYYEGYGGRPLAPYLDGCLKDVDLITVEGNKYLRVTSGGEYHCENQDGSCTSNEDSQTCNDCGAVVDDGDGYWVNAAEDELVCQHCCDNNYYYAYGRRGNQYYVYCNNVVHVGDESYDEDYLGDNDIVSLSSGEYCRSDDAVYVESESEYFAQDDERVCYDDYNDQYAMRDELVELEDGSMCHQDDAWQCEGSNNWYSDDVDSVEVDGNKYHPDHVPVTDDEETECVWTPHNTGPTTETIGE
jgi:hypothetical protein